MSGFPSGIGDNGLFSKGLKGTGAAGGVGSVAKGSKLGAGEGGGGDIVSEILEFLSGAESPDMSLALKGSKVGEMGFVRFASSDVTEGEEGTSVPGSGFVSSLVTAISAEVLFFSLVEIASWTTVDGTGFSIVSSNGSSLEGVGGFGISNESEFSIGFRDLPVRRSWIGSPSMN